MLSLAIVLQWFCDGLYPICVRFVIAEVVHQYALVITIIFFDTYLNRVIYRFPIVSEIIILLESVSFYLAFAITIFAVESQVDHFTLALCRFRSSAYVEETSLVYMSVCESGNHHAKWFSCEIYIRIYQVFSALLITACSAIETVVKHFFDLVICHISIDAYYVP